MHITFQHHSPLPVKAYGGIERMLYWHMKELVRQGHKVSLIGHKDCDLEKEGIELIVQTKESWEDQIPNNTDVVQLFYNYTVKNPNFPTVNTIGGNGKRNEDFTLNTVFVSKKHAYNHASESYVYNALDLSEYPFEKKEIIWDHFFFLAKASWKVKNLKDCLRACKKNKKHLNILGGRALLPSKYIHSFGMVGGKEKLSVMKKSNALLFPVLWEEPFGLAIVESMAMGLPVVGTPFGSLPELINDSVGKICKSYQEFEETIHAPPRNFCSKEIRKYVEDHFSIEHFSKSYIGLFQKVLKGENLNQQKPKWNLSRNADELYSF